MNIEAYKEAAGPFVDLLIRGLFFSCLFFAPAIIFNWLVGREVSTHPFPGVIFGILGDKTSWIIGITVWGAAAMIYFSRKKNRPARFSEVDELAHESHGEKPETPTQPTDQFSDEGPLEIGSIRAQDAVAPTAEQQELSQLKAVLALLETKIETKRQRYSRAVETISRLAESASQPSGKKTMASFGCKLASDDIEELSRTIPALEEERYSLVARIVELQSAAWSVR